MQLCSYAMQGEETRAYAGLLQMLAAYDSQQSAAGQGVLGGIARNLPQEHPMGDNSGRSMHQTIGVFILRCLARVPIPIPDVDSLRKSV